VTEVVVEDCAVFDGVHSLPSHSAASYETGELNYMTMGISQLNYTRTFSLYSAAKRLLYFSLIGIPS
jgi:hypothetical protein